MSENNINPILKAFQEQKVSKLNTELIQAQKLVNLYRALYCFDDAFVEQYNQLLLSSSVEVRRLLSTLMGGNEVRSYFDFLQQRAHPDNNENSKSTNEVKGYLPNPEEDNHDTGDFVVSKEQWESMQAQQKSLSEQTQMLLQILQSKKGTAPVVPTSSQNYSEIVEDDL